MNCPSCAEQIVVVGMISKEDYDEGFTRLVETAKRLKTLLGKANRGMPVGVLLDSMDYRDFEHALERAARRV